VKNELSTEAESAYIEVRRSGDRSRLLSSISLPSISIGQNREDSDYLTEDKSGMKKQNGFKMY